MAPEATLAHSGDFGKDDPCTQISPSTSRLVVEREEHTLGSAIVSPRPCCAIIYRGLNEGWGAHLGDSTARGVWSDTESWLHINSLELKAVFLALKSFEHLCKDQIVLVAMDNTTVVFYVNKEGGMKCNSRRVVQALTSDPDRVVPLSGVQSIVLQMGPTKLVFGTRFNHKLTKFVSPVPDQAAWGGDALGEPGCLRLSSSVTTQQGSFQGDGSGVSQDDPDHSRVAQHVLVLGPGQPVSSDSLCAPTTAGSSDTALQRLSSLRAQESDLSCMAPRASIIQEQGFFSEVAARIEAPQRSSTRAIYKSIWAISVKWCSSNDVDIRSPSMNQIADFLLHFFQDRALQPSSIEGYRTATGDTVGYNKLKISKDENLTRLLDSITQISPRAGVECPVEISL